MEIGREGLKENIFEERKGDQSSLITLWKCRIHRGKKIGIKKNVWFISLIAAGQQKVQEGIFIFRKQPRALMEIKGVIEKWAWSSVFKKTLIEIVGKGVKTGNTNITVFITIVFFIEEPGFFHKSVGRAG